MLLDYVQNTAERIIADKENRDINPACCTLSELIAEVREDIKECMRELHRRGKYRASININHTPMLLRTTKQ